MRKAIGAELNILADLIQAGGTLQQEHIVRSGIGHGRALEVLLAQKWVTGAAMLVTITEAGREAMLPDKGAE